MLTNIKIQEPTVPSIADKGRSPIDYFLRPSFFVSALYARLLVVSRYFKCLRRSATRPRRPRRELLSLRFLSKCWESSSIRRVRIATCTSGEPVSVSWRFVLLISFCFFRFVSMRGMIAHSPALSKRYSVTSVPSVMASASSAGAASGAGSTLTRRISNTRFAFPGIICVPEGSVTPCSP